MYWPIYLILSRNVILQRYHYDVTIKAFVNVHLTASNKSELANQTATYKIIA